MGARRPAAQFVDALRGTAPIGMAIVIAPVPVASGAVPPVAVPIATLAAPPTRVGPAPSFAATLPVATTAATTTAFGERDVVMNRREQDGQPAKEWHQCNHDDCQNHGPEGGCHSWYLLL
jgi:hypothetical protein